MRINVITEPTLVGRRIVRVDIESDRISVSLNLAETIELYQRLSLFFPKPTAADLEFVKKRPETLGECREKIEKEFNRFCSRLADTINQIEQPTIRALFKFLLEMAGRP